MNKITLSLSECLMQSWKAGWPEYCEDPNDDYSAIVKLSDKVAKQLNVNVSDIEGYDRVRSGITNIAKFCRNNIPWSFKNIFYANMCFQTLYNHMKSVSRMKSIQSQHYNYKK
jgi:hypothetical protein